MSVENGVFITQFSARHIALSVRGTLDSSSAWEIHYFFEVLLLPQTRHVSIDFRHCEEFTREGLEILFDFLSEMDGRGLAVELSGIAMSRFALFQDSIGYNPHQVRQDESEFYSIFLMGRRDS